MTEPSPATASRLPLGLPAALLCSMFLGLAIIPSRGAYSEPALLMVLLGSLTLGWRFVSALRGEPATISFRLLVLGLMWSGAFGMAFFAWNDGEIIIYAVRAWDLGRQAQAGVLLLLLTYVPFLFGKWRELSIVRHVRFALLALCLLLAGHDVIRASPRPYIDVWTVQMLGAQALGAGQNPYQAVAVRDTGPRDASDVPYVYPPTQVYWTYPFFRLLGDVRYAMLAALLIAGLALRFITRRAKLDLPALAEDAPALFLWLTPKLYFILEQSWVDPVQVMFISALAAAYVAKREVLTGVLLGVAVSAKQTMFWLLPLALILRLSRRQWIIGGAVGLALVLPFVAWDFRALKHANLDFLSALPARPDALTFTNWVSRKFGIDMPGNLAFLFAAGVAGVSVWKFRGNVALWGVALLSTYLTFFVWNRWAFANYYFLLLSLAVLASALAAHAPDLEQAPGVIPRTPSSDAA